MNMFDDDNDNNTTNNNNKATQNKDKKMNKELTPQWSM